MLVCGPHLSHVALMCLPGILVTLLNWSGWILEFSMCVCVCAHIRGDALYIEHVHVETRDCCWCSLLLLPTLAMGSRSLTV